MRLTLLLLLIISSFSCKGNKADDQQSQAVNANTSLSEAIDKQLQKYIDLDIFSGIVFVAESGEPVYHKAFGMANRAGKVPNTLNTLFDIGSMNKTFTSIVVKQLISEGKLNLDDKLIEYVPGFSDPDASKITVQHLLEHSSGFGDYHMRGYFDLPKSERKLHAIVERAKDYKLLFEPGSSDEYSNLGYVMLGAIIEKSSGKSYFENVHERIVKPLNLENTFLQDFSGLENRIAKGYLYSPLGQLEMNDTMQDEPNPDGGFLSTTSDIYTFYHSYYHDTLLLSEEIKQNDPMFQQLKSLPQGRAIGSAGGFDGFNSVFLHILSDDFTVIVFANMDEPVAERIGSDILKIHRGEELKDPKLPAIQNVRKAYEAYGTEYIKSNFEELTENYHPTDPKDFILNDLGYAFLFGADQPEKAVELFKLNTELFPEVANCWDSYGEGLLKTGNKEAAIAAYKKALEIRPDLQSAKAALDNLK